MSQLGQENREGGGRKTKSSRKKEELWDFSLNEKMSDRKCSATKASFPMPASSNTLNNFGLVVIFSSLLYTDVGMYEDMEENTCD